MFTPNLARRTSKELRPKHQTHAQHTLSLTAPHKASRPGLATRMRISEPGAHRGRERRALVPRRTSRRHRDAWCLPPNRPTTPSAPPAHRSDRITLLSLSVSLSLLLLAFLSLLSLLCPRLASNALRGCHARPSVSCRGATPICCGHVLGSARPATQCAVGVARPASAALT